MNDAVQKGPGRQHNRPRSYLRPIRQNRACDHAFGLLQQINHFPLNNIQPRLPAQQRLYRQPVQLAVRLGAWPLNGRTLAPVQQPELNPRRIGRQPHKPIQRINFAHQMALAQTTDCRVARHRPNRCPRHRHKRRFRPHARRGRSRLSPRMAAANHDHIILFHVKHPHLPIQKLAKISSSKFSTSIRPTK